MLRRVSIHLFAATVLFCAPSRGQTLSPYHVKAACLYNFLKFVEWPPPANLRDDPYIIAVLGEDPFGGVLDSTMKGKTVNGRTILVRRVTEADMRQAHLLFICSSERKRYRQILKGLQGAPVLVVGETEEFAETGGAVEFFIEKNKVRFEINADAAKSANLHVDANLLSLARVVKTR